MGGVKVRLRWTAAICRRWSAADWGFGLNGSSWHQPALELIYFLVPQARLSRRSLTDTKLSLKSNTGIAAAQRKRAFAFIYRTGAM